MPPPNELKWLDLLLPAGLGIASAFYPSAARGARTGLDALGLFTQIESERYRRKLMRQASEEMRESIDKQKAGLNVGREAYIDWALQSQQEKRDAERRKRLGEKEEIGPLRLGSPEIPLVKPDASTTRESNLRWGEVYGIEHGPDDKLVGAVLPGEQQPSLFESAVSGVQPMTFADQLMGPMKEKALEAAPEDIIAEQVPAGPTMLEALTPIDTPWDAQLRMLDVQRAGALVDPSTAAYSLGMMEQQERGREIELERIAEQATANARNMNARYQNEYMLEKLKHGNRLEREQAKAYWQFWVKSQIPISVAQGYLNPGDEGFEFVRTVDAAAKSGKLNPDDPRMVVAQIYKLNAQIENLNAKSDDASIQMAQASTAAIRSLLQVVFQDDKYKQERQRLYGLAIAYGVDVDPTVQAMMGLVSDPNFALMWQNQYGTPPPTIPGVNQ